MDLCDGCRMDSDTVHCLFINHLKFKHITLDDLCGCPCRTCIVKSTCRYDYCESYEIFFAEISRKFKLKFLETCSDYKIRMLQIEVNSLSRIFNPSDKYNGGP